MGWAKRGPSGLIGTNSADSKATVQAMLEDLPNMSVSSGGDPRGGIIELLEQRGLNFVTYEDWQRLDSYEIERGEQKGKVRDKLTSVDEMMEVVGALRQKGLA